MCDHRIFDLPGGLCCTEADWTEIPRSYLPGCASRHRHADGRYCTQVYVDSREEWHFENDDANSGMARCERRHKFDTRVLPPEVGRP